MATSPNDVYEELMNALEGIEPETTLTQYREDGKLEMSFPDGSTFVIVAIPRR